MWSKEECNLLINSWGKVTLTEIQKNIFNGEKSCSTISNKVRQLNLPRSMKFWSKEEINLLKSIDYKNLADVELERYFPNWNITAIRNKAKNLKIYMDRGFKRRKCNLTPLLQETPEAYYWIGFLLADGCFKKNTITLTLHPKDKDHIKKFCNFIEKKEFQEIEQNRLCFDKYIAKGFVQVIASDYIKIKVLKEKFDISMTKTYNPPKNLNKITDHNLFISLFVGYTDGDGTIDQNGDGIKFEMHSSWLDVLKLFRERMYQYFNIKKERSNTANAYITNRGYAHLALNINTIKQGLKQKINELNLPVMARKWDRIKEKVK